MKKIKSSNKKKDSKNGFERFSGVLTKATGSPAAFATAMLLIVAWGVTGPLFGYSDTWQLVINTSTTIITFLMVFIIQQSQNKDTMAVQLKLNELIAATRGASNRLIDIEDFSEKELATIKRFYVKLADLAEKDGDMLVTHTYDEAEENHQDKRREIRPRKSKQ